MFDLETVKKRPFDRKLTEWEIKADKMVHNYANLKNPAVFGYKEMI